MSLEIVYVKLVAKPNTWFKAGTEVFHYNRNRRITLSEWEEDKKNGFGLYSGTRVCEHDYELSLGYERGEERQDGESCPIDEFEAEIIYE